LFTTLEKMIMTSLNRPSDYIGDRTVPVAVTNYHDQVRWGPIVAGLVVAISTQLVLSAFGAAIGLSSIGGSGSPRSDAAGVGVGVGIWAIISLLISLFVGGWVAARTSGRISRNASILNGVILWASMLALSAWLLSSGVAGAFGVAASTASNLAEQALPPNAAVTPPGTAPQAPPINAPNITAQQARDIAGSGAKASWSFVLGSLLGLVAALVGSATGFRNARSAVDDRDLA
jgi:hypothetical protein